MNIFLTFWKALKMAVLTSASVKVETSVHIIYSIVLLIFSRSEKYYLFQKRNILHFVQILLSEPYQV